jgi:cold shock CspA family protein/ribosome-associated translation inhibitor RaiA
MTMPPTITFRRIRGTEALDADIRTRLEKLERYCPSLVGARVLVEPVARHHRAGTHFHIRIDLTVPGEEIATTHEASLRPTARALAARKTQKQDEPDPATKYLGVAIREAFAVARRQLQDYVRRRRRDVKRHAPRPVGRVVRLLPSKACGFLVAEDGREVYFHRNSVLNGGFRDLTVGSRVAFVEERGDKGAQASTVRRVR